VARPLPNSSTLQLISRTPLLRNFVLQEDPHNIHILTSRILRLTVETNLPDERIVRVRPLRRANVPVLGVERRVEVRGWIDRIVLISCNVHAARFLERERGRVIPAWEEVGVGDIGHN
jgi:hypothetical protein